MSYIKERVNSSNTEMQVDADGVIFYKLYGKGSGK